LPVNIFLQRNQTDRPILRNKEPVVTKDKSPKLRGNKSFGVAWAEREALLRGLGLTREDLRKPQVAIFNSWSEISPGHKHLRAVADEVKAGVIGAGGQPFHFNVMGLCDGVALINSEYILPSRDLIVNEIEIYAEAYGMDAMVLVGTCDKIIPAFMMAAARLDIPAIIVTGGYMPAGIHPKTKQRMSFVDVGRAVGSVQSGSMTMEELDDVLDHACPGPGACPMMGTANTMCIIAEAIGLSLPGNATIPADSGRLLEYARDAGTQIMDLWKKGLAARKIVTEKAVRNAICIDMAIGGSTNSMVHIPAIVAEAELAMDCFAVFDEMSHRIPLILGITPNGEHMMDDFDRAGGLAAVCKELSGFLGLDALTVTGKTLAENITGAAVKDASVVRPLSDPIRKDGGLAVLRGNLAPGGAIVKSSAVPANLQKFKGPAKVFTSNADAIAALRKGKIKAGDAVIITFQGCKGAPGLNSTFVVTSEIAGMSIRDSVVLITDGRFSGATEGASVGYISPEAALRGPLIAVRDGDFIEYDIPARTISLCLPDDIIEERMQTSAVPVKYKKGFIGIYQRTVQSLAEGAVLRGAEAGEKNHGDD
jgi:dihydroxy-acid dehydratase